MSALFSTANDNSGINAVTQQANKLLGDYATTPGLPTNIEQGRSGQVEQIANSMIQNLLTSRGQQIGAAESALGAVAPITGVPYGTQQILPGMGTSATTGAGVSPSDPFYQTLQTYAQALANNQGSAIPSSVSGNPALMAQLLQMAQQINPNFNYNTATGVGSAQQSNAATAGTASTQANQQIYSTQLAKTADTYQQTQAIQSSADQLLSSMPQMGINPTDAQIANKTLNQLASQFSSPQYAQFNTNIQNLQAKVSSLLNQGEIPTTATGAAQAIVNGNISFGAMQSTLNQVLLEANQQAASQAQTAANAYQNIQSNVTGNGTSNLPNGANPWH